MEHAESVRVVPADIGWNDVGHWAALADFADTDRDGNVITGDAILIDSRGNIVHSEGPTITIVGAENLVVVATEDSVLVCPKDRAQDVRRVVDALKAEGRDTLL